MRGRYEENIFFSIQNQHSQRIKKSEINLNLKFNSDKTLLEKIH